MNNRSATFLSALLLLVISRSGLAQLLANGQTLTVTTTNAVATFAGADLTGFRNSVTNESYLRLPRPGSALAGVNSIASTGQALTISNWIIGTEAGTGLPIATVTASDSVRSLALTVKIDPASQEIVVKSGAQITSAGLRDASWSFAGLDLNNGHLIVPMDSGVVFDAAHTGITDFIEYPNTWHAQMAVYETAQGTMLLYSTDTQMAFKQLRLTTRGNSTLDVAVVTEALVPFTTATTVPTIEWRLKAFAGDWRVAAQVYKSWLGATRPPASNAAHPWVQNIRAIAGIGTIDSSLLTSLAAEVTASATLLYLSNWRAYSYDVNDPDYTPAAGVASFVAQAHALGFRVMLHTNLIGVSPGNSDYAGLQAYQVKTPETLQATGWLWDRPASTPNRLAYISPASSAFRSVWTARVKAAVEAVHPDALHLDGSAPMMNDGNGLVEGLTYPQGSAQLHRDIIAAFPDLALGGEGMNDIICGYNSFAQAWISDQPIPGQGHPLVTFLFSPQVLYYGHLSQPGATDPAFKTALQQLARRAVLPRLGVSSSSDLDTTNADNSRLIGWIANWEKNAFQPAWPADWTGALIRYQGTGGATAALTDTSSLMTMTAPGATLYQLAHDVNQWASSAWSPNWPAFDNTALYGLDPSAQYWLVSAARPSSVTHLNSVAPGVRLATGTLIGSGFAHVELAATGPPPFDFFGGLFSAQPGVTYQGVDGPLANGAVVALTTAAVGGVSRPALFIHPPWQAQIGGETYVQYSVQVPASAQLQFSAGIQDGATCNVDGVTFRVTVNGSQLYSQNFGLGAWHDGTVNLAVYAGTTVALRLISNPGPLSNTQCDWSVWSQVHIVATPPTQTVSIPLTLAPGSTASGFTGDGSLSLTSPNTATVSSVPVPGKFTVFTQGGAAVSAGTNLASLPFQLWSAATGELARPGAVFTDGSIGPVSSGGVVKSQAISAHPPDGGRRILSWVVNLKKNSGLALGWSAGIADGATSDDGVQFSVLVNGISYWTFWTKTDAWNPGSLDLSPWGGQNVLVQLVTDSMVNSNFDWAYWADLTFYRRTGVPHTNSAFNSGCHEPGCRLRFSGR